MPKRPVKKAAKVRKTVENSEKCLHMHCQQWLVKSGLWDKLLIFHVANERKGGIGAAMHFKRMGVRPGVADYLAFARGRSIAIELKDGDGEQEPDQVRFERSWQRAGHTYYVVRTVEEFQLLVGALVMFA